MVEVGGRPTVRSVTFNEIQVLPAVQEIAEAAGVEDREREEVISLEENSGEKDRVYRLVGAIVGLLLSIVIAQPRKIEEAEEKKKSALLRLIDRDNWLDRASGKISSLPNPIVFHLSTFLVLLVLISIDPDIPRNPLVRWTVVLALWCFTGLYFVYRLSVLREQIYGEPLSVKRIQKHNEIAKADKMREALGNELNKREEGLNQREIHIGHLRKEVKGLLSPFESVDQAHNRLVESRKAQPPTPAEAKKSRQRNKETNQEQIPEDPILTFTNAPVSLPEFASDLGSENDSEDRYDEIPSLADSNMKSTRRLPKYAQCITSRIVLWRPDLIRIAFSLLVDHSLVASVSSVLGRIRTQSSRDVSARSSYDMRGRPPSFRDASFRSPDPRAG
ncbi:hypothetical protein NDN08_006202 [Rhodosorus marinus]|uniref:Uncharacterized protein n=1 Tax=Rhodosorus marinus TaxID=101924 RepID=A0AAV8UNK3_9RHOD|nr:hypothetical protein NDN08_006202 [Rhodosorus marinus]